GSGLQQQRFEQSAHTVGVALHQRGVGVTRAQNPAERRIELDEHEAGRVDAGIDQRLGYRPSTRSQFDHRPGAVRVDIPRHGPRQNLAGGRYGANRQRPFEPGADEAHLIVEPNPLLQLELMYLLLDSLTDVFALLLEQSELALDLAFDDMLPGLQEADLPLDLLFDLLFEFLQGRQRHSIPLDKVPPFLEHSAGKNQPLPLPRAKATGPLRRNSRANPGRRETP